MEILNNDSPKTQTPMGIKVELKEHQKTSLHRCLQIENNDIIDGENHIRTRIGMLSDNVGSGKSLTILSLIAAKPSVINQKFMCSFTGSHSLVNNFRKLIYQPCTINLIIIPHQIITQWTGYIKNNTTLDHYIIKDTKSLKKFTDNPTTPTILLVTSTFFKKFYTKHNNIIYSRVIIDEADVIKIPAFPFIDSVFYWFISSSYKNFTEPRGHLCYQNINGDVSDTYNWSEGYRYQRYIGGVTSTGYIKKICSELSYNPALINKLIILNNQDFIKESFSLVNPIINLIECIDPKLFTILNGIVNNEVLSKINAGDIDAAIKSMKCVKTGEENLIDLVTQELNINLTNLKIKYESNSKMVFSSETSKKECLAKIQESINRTQDKISSINKRLNENLFCAICYDTPVNKSIAKCCSQPFCVECITNWLAQSSNNSCPYCRTKIDSDSLIVVSEGSDDHEKKNTKPNKKDAFSKLIIDIKSNPDSKVLIFSEFDGSFNEIKNELEMNNISYSRMKGSGSVVNNIVSRYKDKNSNLASIQVLLLNSRFFGSGMNLENTTDIIIYHNMSDSLNKQIIGRAQRPGRSSRLNVWRLCNQNETKVNFEY